MEQKKWSDLNARLLISSFICGGAVMALELISAKLIAAYYGNSVYVWSAVLAITLGGLAAGYYTGGHYSAKPKKKKMLLVCIVTAATFTVLMPLISSGIMQLTIGMNIKIGIVISSLVFIFIPLMCFGMISPLLIGIMESRIPEPGRISGIVYSVSTTGGILFTFLTGYYFIPSFGLKYSCYIITILLLFSFLFALFGTREKNK